VKLVAEIKEIFSALEKQILHCFQKHEAALLDQVSEMRSKEASLKAEKGELTAQLMNHTAHQSSTVSFSRFDSGLRHSSESVGSGYSVEVVSSSYDAYQLQDNLEEEASVPRPRSQHIAGSQGGKAESPMQGSNSLTSTVAGTLLGIEAAKHVSIDEFAIVAKEACSESEPIFSSDTPSDTTRSSKQRRERSVSTFGTRSETKTLYGAAMYELLPLWEEVAQKEEMDGSVRFASCRNKTSARSSGLVLDKKTFAKRGTFTKDTLDQVVLSPTSQPRGLWEFTGALLIVYDVIMLPLQLVFQMPWGNFRRVMRWVTGVYWLVDVPSSFCLGFYVDGVLEMRFSRMAKNYLTTWFVPDVVLVALDWIYLLSAQGDDSDAEGAKYVEAGRGLRMLRMVRLLRLVKLNVFLNRVLEQIHSEQIIILTDVLKIIVFIVIVTHIFACAWYGIGASSATGPTWVKKNFQEHDNIGYRYSTSLHWALTQFTPASMEVVPRNTGERIYNVWVLLCALVTFSSFISSITEAMTNLRKINNQRNQEFMQLRSYLRDNRVSKALSARVWRYLKRTSRMRQKRKGWQDVVIFKDMPETLQAEIKVEVYAPIAVACPFFTNFNEANQAAMRAICSKATHEVNLIAGQDLFSPGQVAGGMFLVIEGTLEYLLPDEHLPDEALETTAVSKNHWISESALWLRWLHPGSMVAKSDAALLVLDVSMVHNIFKAYVETLWSCYKYARLFMLLAQKRDEAVTDLPFDVDALTEIAHEAFREDEVNSRSFSMASSESMGAQETFSSRYSTSTTYTGMLVNKALSVRSLISAVSARGRPRLSFK